MKDYVKTYPDLKNVLRIGNKKQLKKKDGVPILEWRPEKGNISGKTSIPASFRKKTAGHAIKTKPAVFMHPAGIEPAFPAPEADALSIGLRMHPLHILNFYPAFVK